MGELSKNMTMSSEELQVEAVERYNTTQIGKVTAPGSTVGNVSGYKCESDCRSRCGEFDPGPVP